jgi:hypothetical protein
VNLAFLNCTGNGFEGNIEDRKEPGEKRSVMEMTFAFLNCTKTKVNAYGEIRFSAERSEMLLQQNNVPLVTPGSPEDTGSNATREVLASPLHLVSRRSLSFVLVDRRES